MVKAVSFANHINIIHIRANIYIWHERTMGAWSLIVVGPRIKMDYCSPSEVTCMIWHGSKHDSCTKTKWIKIYYSVVSALDSIDREETCMKGWGGYLWFEVKSSETNLKFGFSPAPAAPGSKRITNLTPKVWPNIYKIIQNPREFDEIAGMLHCIDQRLGLMSELF